MKPQDQPVRGRDLDSFSAARQLGHDPEPPVNRLAMAQQLADRSRRRVRSLTLATVLAWILACGGGIWAANIYNEIQRGLPLLYYRYAQLHIETEGIDWNELSDDQQRELSAWRRQLEVSNDFLMFLTQASIFLFGIASLLSVWLVVATRRATLRQINANLLAITTELRGLMPPEQSGT